MLLPQKLIKKQIPYYKHMIISLENIESDKKLYTIWNERINTLESVLFIIEIESKG